MKKLTKTEETKLMIIENFIDYFTSNDVERLKMKMTAFDYVDEDHVDEIEQAGFVIGNHKLPTISAIDVEFEEKEKSTTTVSSLDNGVKIELTETQKNKAVEDDLIHYDGLKWICFEQDLEKLKSITKYIN